MISLNYAKKIGDRYVMNFYADTEEDVSGFDPSADFLSYGKPLDGSVLTVAGSGEKINYYVSNGSLIPIGGGDSPIGPIAYDLTYSDFVFEEQFGYASAKLSNFTLNPLDNWKLNISGADGVSGTGIAFEYENDEKEGERFVAAVGTGANVGIIQLDMFASDVEGEGTLKINTKNQISSANFTDLHIEIYK